MIKLLGEFVKCIASLLFVDHSFVENFLHYNISAIENMALERALMLTLFVVLCQEIKGCNVDSDCLGSLVCCYNFCVSNCVGPKSCVLNSDCNGLNGDYYCCDGICLTGCAGSDCSSDSDCGGPNEYCCDNTCGTERCVPGWAIALTVFSSLSFFGIIFGGILCGCTSYRRSTSRRLLANVNPAPRAAVVGDSTVNYGSVHPPLNAPPPPYHYQPTQNG